MTEYPKIQGLFKRDPKTKKFIEDQWSLPEFEYLKYNLWHVTEKIDGTNIRVIWQPSTGISIFKGKTDAAQLHPKLIKRLNYLFPPHKMQEHFPDTDVCLYGEGYGAGIQSGGWYIPDAVDFILFDVRIGNWWLKWNDVVDLAQSLEITHVPDLGLMSLTSAIALIKGGTLKSAISHEDRMAEGIVCRNTHGMLLRNGQRIITKIKHVDWR
jgi:ATP-dependent RNA circularization protein (DNA/RNA ligase family)